MPRPVLVGVDGSPQSVRALEWALDYAALSGAVVRAFCAWEVPPLGGVASFGDPQVLRAAAEEVVAKVLADVASGGVTVEGQAMEGHPAKVLVEQSGAAQLLVLGARGGGGFADMLLGSVTSYCSHHAKCPVVIVRGD